MNKKFPCWVCKGQGTWVEVVIEETGQGPLESCIYCEGEGTIETGGKIHRRIVAERIAMDILRFNQDSKVEWTNEELQELGNRAIDLRTPPLPVKG